MEIVYKSISALSAAPHNARTHSDEQVQQIVASIHEFGFTNPVLIDEKGEIIAGHGRTQAAKTLGWTEVPTITLKGLTEAQKRAYCIADNQLSLNAGWDLDVLKSEVLNLQSAEFDVNLLGFADDFLDQLLQDAIPEGLEAPDAGEIPETPKARPGDVWILGKHRIICGDATELNTIEKLMGEDEADLMLTDPPYNVAYVGKTKEALTIENDSMSDEQFENFLGLVFSNADAFMRPGAAFYIWHADSKGYSFRKACMDTHWEVRQCLVWVKNTMVLGRQDYQWKHEPCQPAGTQVLTPTGYKPIEQFTDNDRVVSFDTYSGTVKGFRDGLAIKTAKRAYDGQMYAISVGGNTTKATDTHKFSVRFNPEAAKYCTYLMKKGDWWRIGFTRAYDARQFGLKTRFAVEGAEAAWILDTYESKQDALLAEELLGMLYGIPQTHWEPSRGFKSQNYAARGHEYIQKLYDSLDLDELGLRAKALLEKFGRNINVPLLDADIMGQRFSRRVTAQIPACNLIAGLMQVPVPYSGWDGNNTFSWQEIDKVEFEAFQGDVYSLEVEKYEHYISDGIVTHNCLYGWKAGAAHHWGSDRKQTTVLEFAKPNASRERPTMKPVDLFEYQIKNSCKQGGKVLDIFSGSGTTLLACELSGRIARVAELDPRFVDVAIERWQKMTGQKAVHAVTGQEFDATE